MITPPLSRNVVIVITLLADVLGTAVIVFALSLSWTPKLIAVVAWLTLTNSLSRLYLRRIGG